MAFARTANCQHLRIAHLRREWHIGPVQLGEIEGLYRKYGPMVLRRAERILGDREAARDVLQEVFVSAIKSHAAFRAAASPSTWLYTITTNACLQQLRDTRSRASKLEVEGAHLTNDQSPASSDAMTLLRQALRLLPTELAQVAVHYYVDQMSHDEIAALLNVSRRTVGNRLEAFQKSAREAGLQP